MELEAEVLVLWIRIRPRVHAHLALEDLEVDVEGAGVVVDVEEVAAEDAVVVLVRADDGVDVDVRGQVLVDEALELFCRKREKGKRSY